jgi:hypothetical protein
MRRHQVRLIAITAVLLLGVSVVSVRAADTSKVDEAKKQVESGAKQIGQGVEETAKGIGKTVVEGAKVAGEKMKEAARDAEPQAKSAWQKTKNGVIEAGESVKSFFKRLFGG